MKDLYFGLYTALDQAKMKKIKKARIAKVLTTYCNSLSWSKYKKCLSVK